MAHEYSKFKNKNIPYAKVGRRLGTSCLPFTWRSNTLNFRIYQPEPLVIRVKAVQISTALGTILCAAIVPG